MFIVHALRSRMIAAALIVVAAAASGCASSASSMTIAAETKGKSSLSVEGPGSHRAFTSAHVDGANTVLEIEGAKIVCEGYTGYRGRIGTHDGELVVGALTLAYDDGELRFAGPDGRGLFTLQKGMEIVVTQSGAAQATFP